MADFREITKEAFIPAAAAFPLFLQSYLLVFPIPTPTVLHDAPAPLRRIS